MFKETFKRVCFASLPVRIKKSSGQLDQTSTGEPFYQTQLHRTNVSVDGGGPKQHDAAVIGSLN